MVTRLDLAALLAGAAALDAAWEAHLTDTPMTWLRDSRKED